MVAQVFETMGRRRSRGLEIVFELGCIVLSPGSGGDGPVGGGGRSGVCGRKLGKACLKELIWGRRGGGGWWTGLDWAGLDWIGLD